MEIIKVPVSDLVAYEGNAKEHTADQVRQIALSIEEFGNCDPIGVWTNKDGLLEIVEGHGRVMALKLLGEEIAPVIKLDHLTDDQRRAYCHIHNHLTLQSGFDYDQIMSELESINCDFADFGFEEYLKTADFSKREQNIGAQEIDIEEYSKERFDCCCPECGMRFDIR